MGRGEIDLGGAQDLSGRSSSKRRGKPVADPNFAPPGDVGLLVALLKYASLISRPMLEAVAAPNGISQNELRVLISLGGEGEAAGHALATMMGMRAMNVSRALQMLHARGWVEEGRDAANKRRKPFRLSALGHEAYRAMTPEVQMTADFLFRSLSTAERQQLQRLVDKLLDQVLTWKGLEMREDGLE